MAGGIHLNRYFERVGFAGSLAPIAATLEQILAAQAATIPYESLGAILGEPSSLAPEALEERLVAGRRGGTGFELNTLLLHVLADLDFDVAPLVASRLAGRDPDSDLAPLDHMALRVELAGEPLLVDAGLGALTPTAPLRFDPWVEQPMPDGSCRLVDAGEGRFDVEMLRPSGWTKLSRVWPDTADADALAVRHAALVGEPQSALRRRLVVGKAALDARREIVDNLAIDYPRDGEATATIIASLGDLRERLLADFAIALPAGEGIDTTLAALIGAPLPAGGP